jgi:hypothetical protein
MVEAVHATTIIQGGIGMNRTVQNTRHTVKASHSTTIPASRIVGNVTSFDHRTGVHTHDPAAIINCMILNDGAILERGAALVTKNTSSLNR